MAAKKTDEVIETKVEKNEDPTSETVVIKLFKDSDKYSDDVQVGVNGKIYTVQRGVPVAVPRAVAEIIWHQEAQDDRTAKLIDRYENEYKTKAAKYNR